MPARRPKHRMTRKNLRQDSFVDWTGRAYSFIQDHYLALAGVAAAIVVIVVAATFYVQGGERSRERASQLLYEGQTLLAQGSYAGASERLQEVVDSYGGTTFGLRAHADLARALLGMGEREAALGAVQDGLDAVGDDRDLRLPLLLVEGAALTDLARYDDATTIYGGLLAQDLPVPLRIEATFRLAEVQKLSGDMKAAVATLEKLEDAVEAGEIPSPVRDLRERLQIYRALASR